MQNRLAVLALLGSLLPTIARAQGPTPAPVLPDTVHWVSPPTIPGLTAAWLLGAEQKPGPYILRVRLAAGTRLPPHTHPDERNSTVLAGTIYVGFGKTFDTTKVVAIPAGAVYVAPAGVPHYVWARDGAAMYQEAGVGPTGTSVIEP